MNENEQSQSFMDDNNSAIGPSEAETIALDWDEDNSGFAAEEGAEPAAGADQPGGGDKDPGEDAPREGEEELFELKHLDERRRVSRAELIALAQKGMDYDRIRAKYDALRADRRPETAQETLPDEEQSGETGEPSDPKARTAPEGEEQPGPSPADVPATQRQQSFMRFAREYPQVKPETIPAEIWRDFIAGRGDLAGLYALHENRQLKAELTLERQSRENRSRSTGSRATAGSTLSALDADWYDGT